MTRSQPLARLGLRSVRKAPLRSLLIVSLIALLVGIGSGVAIVLRSSTPTNEDHRLAVYGQSDTAVSFAGDTWHQYLGHGRAVLDPLDNPVAQGTPAYEDAVEADAQQRADDQEWIASFDAGAVETELEQQLDHDVLISRRGYLQDDQQPGQGPFGSYWDTEIFTAIDMNHPLASGMFEIVDGRWPEGAREVAVTTSQLERRQVSIGDQVDFRGATLIVVGTVVKPASQWEAIALVSNAGFDDLAIDIERIRYQVNATLDRDEDELGSVLTALESAVGRDITVQTRQFGIVERSGDRWQRVAVASTESMNQRDLSLVTVPILVTVALGMQIALVAAAAFAVGIRRRTREFGQLITVGADQVHLKRLVLFEGGWLGLSGALCGIGLGVSGAALIINQRWLASAATRYPVSMRWSATDLAGPALVGLMAALVAAWWPTRTLAKAPTSAMLGGHLPSGRPNPLTPRWGLAIVAGGTALLGALSVQAVSAAGTTGVLTGMIALTICAIFLGVVMLIGSILSVAGRHAHRLPLLLRLVVRSSDRQRARSWMVVGAFVATMALPVILGASVKAYPQSYSSPEPSAFTDRLLTLRTSYGNPYADPDRVIPSTDLELLDDLDQEFGDVATDVLGAVKTVPLVELPGAQLQVVGDRFGRSYSNSLLVATAEVVAFLGLDASLVDQLAEPAAVDLGSGRSRLSSDGDGAQLSTPGGDSIGMKLVEGPELFGRGVVLVSPSIADELQLTPEHHGTLRLAEAPISRSQFAELGTRANELWVDRFGPLAYDQHAPVPVNGSAVEPGVALAWQVELSVDRGQQNGPTQGQVRWIALGVSALLASLVAFVTASLAAVELDQEIQSMIATGAAPTVRRTMLGAQTLYHLVIAAFLGIPLALLLFAVVARADEYGPRGITVPWTSIGVVAIAIPVAVAALVSLVFRNGQPAVSRRLS